MTAETTTEYWIDLVTTGGFAAMAARAAETTTSIQIYEVAREDFAEDAAAALHHALAGLGAGPVRVLDTRPSVVTIVEEPVLEETIADHFEVILG
jgi:hypothetical protein